MAIHKNLSASTWSSLKIQFPKEGNKTKVIGFLRMQHLLRRKKYWKSQAKVVGSDDGWECRSHLLKRQGYRITRCVNNISISAVGKSSQRRDPAEFLGTFWN